MPPNSIEVIVHGELVMGRSGSLTAPREEQALGRLHFCDVLPWGSRLICDFSTQSDDEAGWDWKRVRMLHPREDVLLCRAAG